jgi:peptidoglycan-N-acetylglucosamine deacetylase
MGMPMLSRTFMLTFDDGPLPGKTDRVLDAVKKMTAADGTKVRVAFFMIGDAPQDAVVAKQFFAPYEIWIHKGSMQRYPELVRRVLAEGHFVGNHTAHHAWLRWPWFWSHTAIHKEIRDWENHAGEPLPKPKLFRPPHLIENEGVALSSAELGYQIVTGYTVGDASPTDSVQDIQARISRIFADPKIPVGQPVVLIFHDIMPKTYEHLSEIVSYLQQQGHTLIHFDPAKLVSTVKR